MGTWYRYDDSTFRNQNRQVLGAMRIASIYAWLILLPLSSRDDGQEECQGATKMID